MKKVHGLILAAMAGSCGSAAFAQAEPDALPVHEIRPISIVSNGVELRDDSFGQRVPVTVYDQYVSNSSLATSYRLLEDVMFAPGPYATATSRTLNRMDLAFQNTNGAPVQLYIIVRFWDVDDVNRLGWGGVAGAHMINPAAVMLGQTTYNFGLVNSGSQYTSTNNILGTVNIQDSDPGVFVELILSNDGVTQAPQSLAGLSFLVGSASNALDPGNPAIVGLTDRAFGRDRNGDGILAGSAVAGAPAENTFVLSSGRSTGVRMRLHGDLPAPIPPCEALGNIADGATNLSTTLAAGEVKWYCMSMLGEAVDASKRYFDIASQVSSSADVAIGIYLTDGTRVQTDDNDGDGLQAALSFGLGIRNGQGGDALQNDGRDGQLASGDYLIAVTSSPAVFNTGFIINSTGAGGTADIRIDTNQNNGAAFAEVPPVIETGRDFGIISGSFAGPTFTPVATNNQRVGWYKFEICEPATAAGLYLDIDASFSHANADAMYFLFDNNGNLLTQNDDADADGVAPFYRKPHFSFGNVGPRPPYGADPLEANYAGESGELPAGTYYLATALFNAGGTADAAFDGNWHIRALSGSSLPIAVDIYTDMTQTPCTGGGCPWETFGCTADQDGDDDVDSDDIVVFFSNFENGDTCGDQDADEDVDSDDIVIFFGLFEQGGC